MSEEYELVPIDPIRKLESEVEELKQYLKSLKEELAIKTHENINNNIPQDHQHSEDDHLIRVLIDYAKTNQEIINSLIRTNIELQSKIAELVVSTHELNKGIHKLVEIFEEAAIEYMEKMNTKKESKKEEGNNELLKKLEDLEKINLKIAEALDKLSKSIESIKSTNTTHSQSNIKKIVPPPIRPPFPPVPPQGQHFR
ncbi:MAG TPA: hypothetical protein EYH22_03880 [Candidatus Nanopusillus sp.]|nr:hypothetical protein [Candidatus Nanopusillus sp.]